MREGGRRAEGESEQEGETLSKGKEDKKRRRTSDRIGAREEEFGSE